MGRYIPKDIDSQLLYLSRSFLVLTCSYAYVQCSPCFRCLEGCYAVYAMSINCQRIAIILLLWRYPRLISNECDLCRGSVL